MKSKKRSQQQKVKVERKKRSLTESPLKESKYAKKKRTERLGG